MGTHPQIVSAASSSSSLGNGEGATTTSSPPDSTSHVTHSSSASSAPVGSQGETIYATGVNVEDEDADMITYFESKLVAAAEKKPVAGEGNEAAEGEEGKLDYSLRSLLNLQSDRPTFKNRTMEAEFLRSNAKTAFERDFEFSSATIIVLFLIYIVLFNVVHLPGAFSRGIEETENFFLSGFVAADNFFSFMRSTTISYKIYTGVVAFWPSIFIFCATSMCLVYSSGRDSDLRDRILLLASIIMTSLFVCMYGFYMEMEILSRQNHCAHHKKSETNDIVDVSSIYFEKSGNVLQFMYDSPTGFTTTTADKACLQNVYRGMMVSTVSCLAFYSTLINLVVKRYYHCAITHIFSYIAIFFMFQSHVQNSILANADPNIRSNLNSLVDENKFTGFILIFAVMYKEYVDNSFARAKWGEERWNVWKTKTSIRKKMERYKILQHKIQNAVIEVEGIIAEALTKIIEFHKDVLSEKKEFAVMDVNERITYDMENILQKAIKIKRNIHSHDMIRQIGDKTYQEFRNYESTEDIISLLTEGEGSQVKVVIGESCRSHSEGQVQKFLVDSDALSFVFADAIRNANKYSPQGHTPTISIDYDDEGRLTICCRNKVDPSRHKTLTADEIVKIFAREANLAKRGYISSNLGLPAAYAAATFLPGYSLEFYEDEDKTVKFVVILNAPSKFFNIEEKLPNNLVGVACDDSLVSRKTVKMFMDRKLELSEESYVLGETREEVLMCTDYVLGNVPGFAKADIVIMDQNLDYAGHEMLYGTHIAAELHKRGFMGILVIMSANSSRLEEAIYKKVPGVDCVCGKHLTINHKNNKIISAWFKKQEFNKKKAKFLEAKSSE
ncbi:hypothetical protein TrST_g9632 [Triparma strigata]|uniref:Response regulatory domain-containing protein n=1 Tax=Triparma strigata TaxID=1606541 RepID=A0A9W6ZS71_9STRA|nr:hypothetical protein TrST_g9632 [Triparma strigata]